MLDSEQRRVSGSTPPACLRSGGGDAALAQSTSPPPRHRQIDPCCHLALFATTVTTAPCSPARRHRTVSLLSSHGTPCPARLRHGRGEPAQPSMMTAMAKTAATESLCPGLALLVCPCPVLCPDSGQEVCCLRRFCSFGVQFFAVGDPAFKRVN